MTNQEILDECLAKPGAYEDYPFGPEVTVVKVKAPSQETGRIFAQIFSLKNNRKVTLNCDIMTGEMYRQMYPGTVSRGYHCPPVQQPYFNTVSLDGTVPPQELRRMIAHSYDTVRAKLPKYAQKELEERE